ncbi:MAG TPA: hypothetical protein VLX29_07575 [Nitrospirota bacterium]|nr:hypothetical protein [Nitrospirota bacterium]
MMHFDALTVLLFIEFTVICLLVAIIFFFKSRKHRLLYKKALREIMIFKSFLPTYGQIGPSGGKEAQKKEAASTSIAISDTRSVEYQKEKDLLNAKAVGLEKQLQEKTKCLADLGQKYAVLEKEYSVLYGKHFDGKGKAT